MKTMSAIYQKVRHRLTDDWAYGNGRCTDWRDRHRLTDDWAYGNGRCIDWRDRHRLTGLMATVGVQIEEIDTD